MVASSPEIKPKGPKESYGLRISIAIDKIVLHSFMKYFLQ
ncbi:hypothetical protein CCACVL1_06253, partial [Corchorus capsularis]